MIPALLDRRFVLVTGKGGVGKSTVTALLAAASAAAGRRTLVCELNTQERIAPLFGQPHVGHRVGEIAPNLFAVNMRPAAALEEYALLKLRFKALYSLVFENPLVRRFVGMVPGLDDLLLLGKAFNHERERVDGSPKKPLAWDCVIVDAPATGHGVTFFRLPRVILDYVPVGNMHDEAKLMWDLLTDPLRTAVHLVCLPEELPVQETRELHATLSKDLGMPMGALWLNQVPPPWGTPEIRAAVEALPRPTPGSALPRPTPGSALPKPTPGSALPKPTPGSALPQPTPGSALETALDVARVRVGREAQAARYAAELAALGMPLRQLPVIYRREFDIEALNELLRAAEAQS